jgi:hypothetical protein
MKVDTDIAPLLMGLSLTAIILWWGRKSCKKPRNMKYAAKEQKRQRKSAIFSN